VYTGTVMGMVYRSSTGIKGSRSSTVVQVNGYSNVKGVQG